MAERQEVAESGLAEGLTDPGERRSVTRSLGEYILPLDRIPGVPPWNTDKRRLAPAGSLQPHAQAMYPDTGSQGGHPGEREPLRRATGAP